MYNDNSEWIQQVALVLKGINHQNPQKQYQQNFEVNRMAVKDDSPYLNTSDQPFLKIRSIKFLNNN